MLVVLCQSMGTVRESRSVQFEATNRNECVREENGRREETVNVRKAIVLTLDAQFTELVHERVHVGGRNSRERLQGRRRFSLAFVGERDEIHRTIRCDRSFHVSNVHHGVVVVAARTHRN